MIKTEKQAQRLIESMLKIQEGGSADAFPCPRCGHNSMRHENEENALSRHANVYICPECGTQEALLDMRNEQLPFLSWGMVRGFTEE